MIKVLFAIVLLINFSYCQRQVINQWSSTSQPVVKEFETHNEEAEVAIYGWFKMSPSKLDYKFGRIFFVTDQEKYSDGVNIQYEYSQSVFSILNIGTSVVLVSYSIGSNNGYQQGQTFDIAQDMGKWSFFHSSYSPDLKRVFTQYNFATVGTKVDVIENVHHKRSRNFKVYLGQFGVADNAYIGELKLMAIRFGPGSYKESDFDSRSKETNNCVIIFSQCNYQGESINYCDSKSTMNFKSILIPDGKKITFSNPKNPSQKIVYDKNVACITSFWSFLSNSKVSITNKEYALRRNSSRRI